MTLYCIYILCTNSNRDQNPFTGWFQCPKEWLRPVPNLLENDPEAVHVTFLRSIQWRGGISKQLRGRPELLTVPGKRMRLTCPLVLRNNDILLALLDFVSRATVVAQASLHRQLHQISRKPHYCSRPNVRGSSLSTILPNHLFFFFQNLHFFYDFFLVPLDFVSKCTVVARNRPSSVNSGF